jgi:hypothetical protein
MKRLVCMNRTGRSFPLQGKDGTSLTIPKTGQVTLEENYFDHYHFKSLKRRGMMVVVREEVIPPPKEAKPASPPPRESSKTSSFPRQRRKQKAQDKTEGMEPEVTNADGE